MNKKFRADVFLYRMLAVIFATEAGFLAFAFVRCSAVRPGEPPVITSERCPKLGERAETLFVAAVATTLSLLSGAISTSMKEDARDESSQPLPDRRLPHLPQSHQGAPAPAPDQAPVLQGGLGDLGFRTPANTDDLGASDPKFEDQ